MSRREYRRRASLGKCHRRGRCRWVRGVPADRPASVASLSALLAVSRPQTPQATPPTREQRLRCVLCLLTCLDPKHHVAHPFVWHDVRSGVVFDRGCHQFEHVSMPLVSLVHQTGAEVAATLHRVEVPSRPRRSADASGPPASSRCARLLRKLKLYYDFPVHAPNRTQHAPSISYRCRPRRSICRIGLVLARTLQLSEQAIRSTAVRYGPGTIRGRAGCLTNDQYGADTTADCMADVAVSVRRSLGNKLELCLERVAHLRLELRVRRER